MVIEVHPQKAGGEGFSASWGGPSRRSLPSSRAKQPPMSKTKERQSNQGAPNVKLLEPLHAALDGSSWEPGRVVYVWSMGEGDRSARAARETSQGKLQHDA